MIPVWKDYVVSVLGSCMICGILSGFTTNSGNKKLIRLVCGIYITITVVSPLVRGDITWKFPDLTEAADTEAVLAAGEELALTELNSRIIAGCEAYILDKANLKDGRITVRIFLGADQLPESAEILGDYTAQDRLALEAVLEGDLGITKENQRWTGNQERNGS